MGHNTRNDEIGDNVTRITARQTTLRLFASAVVAAMFIAPDTTSGSTFTPRADPADQEALKGAIRRALCRPREIPEGLDYFSYENFRDRLQNIIDGSNAGSVSST